MALNRPNALKVTRSNADVTAMGASAKLEFLTAADAILATISLPATAATVDAAGVITVAGLPATVAATATGTIAKARIRTGANADVWTGLTVGLSASDINLTAVVVSTVGQSITLSSFTDTPAA